MTSRKFDPTLTHLPYLSHLNDYFTYTFKPSVTKVNTPVPLLVWRHWWMILKHNTMSWHNIIIVKIWWTFSNIPLVYHLFFDGVDKFKYSTI